MKYFFTLIVICAQLNAAFENADRSELLIHSLPPLINWNCRALVLSPLNYSFLGLYEFQISYRHQRNSFRIELGTSGDNLYRESLIKIGLSREIGSNSVYGILLRYYQLRIKNYGSAGCVGFGFAGRYKLTNSTGLEVSFHNLLFAPKNTLAGEIPQILRVSVHQKLPANQWVEYVFEKEEYFASGHYFFWSVTPVEFVKGRLGFATNPQEIIIGGSLHYNAFTVDGGVAVNPALGPSLFFGLTYD